MCSDVWFLADNVMTLSVLKSYFNLKRNTCMWLTKYGILDSVCNYSTNVVKKIRSSATNFFYRSFVRNAFGSFLKLLVECAMIWFPPNAYSHMRFHFEHRIVKKESFFNHDQ